MPKPPARSTADPARYGPDACPSPSEVDDYFAGRSDALRRDQAEAHIAACCMCRQLLAGLARTVDRGEAQHRLR